MKLGPKHGVEWYVQLLHQDPYARDSSETFFPFSAADDLASWRIPYADYDRAVFNVFS